jgi:hypothetical protein
MAKEAGFPFSLSVDDSAGAAKDIANDVASLQISTPRGVQDVTGIDSSAMERLLLLADGSVTLTGAAFNDAANKSFAVFKTVSSSSIQRTTTLAVSGQTLAMEMIYTDFSHARGQDGSLTWSAPGVLANGVVPTWA